MLRTVGHTLWCGTSRLRQSACRRVAAASSRTSVGTPHQEVFRILAPTAILGYGFPKTSFDAALAAQPIDLIAVDAGSIDPGPYYLAARSSFTALQHVVRDLRVMIQGFMDQRSRGLPCKLVVGSAGGCGTNNQLDIMAEEVTGRLVQSGPQRS